MRKVEFPPRMLLIVVATLLGCGSPVGAAAESSKELPAPKSPPGSVGNSEKVGLDKLLKLPSSYRFDDARRAGATRSEWRARFEDTRKGVEEAQQKLERVRAELEELVGGASSWQMAPPGMDLKNAENPISYRLTQELRRGYLLGGRILRPALVAVDHA